MGALKLRELPGAGHFIDSERCRFKLHHHVGRYCISTVGDYWPRSGARSPLGYTVEDGVHRPAWYETMTFDTRGKTRRWHDLVCRRSMTEEAARETHAATCAEFLSMASREARKHVSLRTARNVIVPPKAKVGVVERRPSRGRRP